MTAPPSGWVRQEDGSYKPPPGSDWQQQQNGKFTPGGVAGRGTASGASTPGSPWCHVASGPPSRASSPGVPTTQLRAAASDLLRMVADNGAVSSNEPSPVVSGDAPTTVVLQPPPPMLRLPGPSGRRSPPPRRSASCCRKCCRWLVYLARPQWSCMALVVVLMSGPWVPVLIRALSAVIGFTEELTLTSAQMLKASTNATIAFTDVALQVSRGALSLAQEFWGGVDLNDVSANATATRWYQVVGLTADELMQSHLGHTIRELPIEWRELILSALGSIGPEIPAIRDTRRRFFANDMYQEFEFQMVFRDNAVGIQLFYGAVRFRAVWANPAWQLMGHDLGKALSEISDLVHAALDRATNVGWRRSEIPSLRSLGLPAPRRPWLGSPLGQRLDGGSLLLPVEGPAAIAAAGVPSASSKSASKAKPQDEL